MKKTCFIQRFGFLVRFCKCFISAPYGRKRCLKVGTVGTTGSGQVAPHPPPRRSWGPSMGISPVPPSQV